MADLGVYRGSGTWGVSTLKINPVTNDPMVVLFETEGEALDYARQRALRSGSPVRVPGKPPDRSVHGRIYYILRYLPNVYDDQGRRKGELLYRALRGMRGAMQAYQGSIQERNIEQILVFKLVGEAPESRWVLVANQSVDVPQLEAEYEKERLSRGKQRISRVDMGRDPRGHKQAHIRQGRPPLFGPTHSAPTTPFELGRRQRQQMQVEVEHKRQLRRESETVHEQQRQSAIRFAEKLRERLANLKLLKERLEQDFLKTRSPQLERRLQLVDEKMEEVQQQLYGMTGEE